MTDKQTISEVVSRPTHRSPYGDSLRWITGEEETLGAYSMHERTAPPGAASVPHIHSRISEAFYVLDGEFTFRLDERTLVASAGAYVHAAAGVSHAWRVTGATPARALVIFAPGLPLAFFEELDAAVSRDAGERPDVSELAAINKKYGLD